MGVMNRVECSSIDRDVFQRPTLNAQRSTETAAIERLMLKVGRLPRRRLAEGGLRVDSSTQ